MRFEFQVRAALESHPMVESLRVTLRERHGLSERSTETFLESILSHIFEDAGKRYVGEISARMRHIEQLRSQLHHAVGEVVAGRHLPPEMSPQNMSRLFDELQAEMNRVVSPRQYLEAHPTDALGLDLTGAAPAEPAAAVTPEVAPTHTTAPTGASHAPRPEAIGNWLDRLSHEDQSLFNEVNSAANSELAAVIGHESGEHRPELVEALRDRLHEEGFPPEQIDRTVDLAERASVERGMRERGLPRRVRDLVGWDPLLTAMSREHPDLLLELARDFDQAGGGTRSAFSRHVRQELANRGLEIQPDTPIPRVARPRGSVTAPEVRVEPTARLNPGEVTRNAETGATVICNYAGFGHERLGFEDQLHGAVEVGLEGWHRAHSQGPGTGKESAHGILYAPPEVNLGYQNLGIERYIREAVAQLDPEARMVLTTSTRAHPESLRLASIEYKIEIEVNGTRTRVLEAGLEIANTRDNPRVTSWAESFDSLEQFFR